MKFLAEAIDHQKRVINTESKAHTCCEVECIDTDISEESEEIENKEGTENC